ncbi:MAG: hypothetical protein QOH62_2484 [Solirubrobacteraceae bacterium]|nr:hypothetical protein [Solirubrobacteraceae bacterium]
MKAASPEVVRKGALARIAGGGEPGARVLALEFVDLRFPDGHVERWLGMGWIHVVPIASDPMPSLLEWVEGRLASEEGNLSGELKRAFAFASGTDPLAGVPSEIVVEWNAKLPPEAFAPHR